MFYSHEVLTSRKYGVATVWLVATLGAKSGLKKINRKAILDVNIPKACVTITTPEAPMALRLQSSLLYGVSRVYSEQCSYVLTDVQLAQSQMRTLLKAARISELDPDAGKARPDQLVLQDDPAFSLEMFLPSLDQLFLGVDEWSSGSSQQASVLSRHSQASSRSSNKDVDVSVQGLILSGLSSGGGIEMMGSDSAGPNFEMGTHDSILGGLIDLDDGFDANVDFNFDAEGNIVELRDIPEPGGGALVFPRARSSSALAALVIHEHAEALLEGRRAAGDAMEYGMNLLELGDNEYGQLLPEAEAFPERAHEDFKYQSLEESSEPAKAAQTRKPRSRKAIPVDVAQELRNSALALWSSEYLVNMADAARQKLQLKATSQAKKNAAVWVFGAGIGGVGTGLGQSKLPSPLDMFSGEKLMEALTGIPTEIRGRKRPRNNDEDDEADALHHARFRSNNDSEFGRSNAVPNDNADDMLPLYDDTAIELGRDAGPLLEDHSSHMPWNQSALLSSRQNSRHGSISRSRPPRFSSFGGFPTSAGQPGSLPGHAASFDRRSSRLVSASPLHGRGSAGASALGLPGHGDSDEVDLPGGDPGTDDAGLDKFRLFGPGAEVDTQTAGQSQWVRGALDRESGNFLEFVRARVGDAEGETGAMGAEGGARWQNGQDITFAELLPPKRHTDIVAAQAFHHLLVLATKGFLSVAQEGGFGGPIRVRCVGGGESA